MKLLIIFTIIFVVLSTLGFTIYFDDPNPWYGWFAPLWFGSLAGMVLSLSLIGISRALSEIANPPRKRS